MIRQSLVDVLHAFRQLYRGSTVTCRLYDRDLTDLVEDFQLRHDLLLQFGRDVERNDLRYKNVT